MDDQPTMTLLARSSPAAKPNALTQLYEDSFESLRNLIGCKICVKPMYEPYTISCGHTFCYSCLAQWFSNHRTNKTCPECRAKVRQQPAPSYTIRDMTQIFLSRAELLPVEDTLAEHEKAQQEEADIVEKDRINITPGIEGLFRGCFSERASRYQTQATLIQDFEDGVTRCPVCTWELENGWCNSCEIDYEIEDWMGSVTHLSDSDGYDEAADGDELNEDHTYSVSAEATYPRRARYREGRSSQSPLSTADETNYSDGSIDTSLDGFITDGPDPDQDGISAETSTNIDSPSHQSPQELGSETATILSDWDGGHDTPHNHREDASSNHHVVSSDTLPPRPGRGFWASDSESSAARGDGDESQGGSDSDAQVSVGHRASRKRRRVVSDDSEEEREGVDGENTEATERSRSRRPRLSSGDESDDQDSAGGLHHYPGCTYSRKPNTSFLKSDLQD